MLIDLKIPNKKHLVREKGESGMDPLDPETYGAKTIPVSICVSFKSSNHSEDVI